MCWIVISSLVCSRFDYANSLLFGTTQKNINCLQRVQNTIARVVASHAIPCGTDSFDIHQDLHWLSIGQRTEFKLATLMYNILNFSQPAYLRSLLNYHTFAHSLRSANTNLLSVPCIRTTIAAPTVWNSLSSSIRSSTSADTFHHLLKTRCFQQAYCSPSSSAKCLRFDHWLTLCTLNMHLLTYLLIESSWILLEHAHAGQKVE